MRPHRHVRRRDAAVEMLVEMKESGWVPTELAYIQVFKTIRGTEVRKRLSDPAFRRPRNYWSAWLI